jgi:hypothetical protein
VRLACEAADARSEKVARAIEDAEGTPERKLEPLWQDETFHDGWCAGQNDAADTARATITKPKPQTREQALEEALPISPLEAAECEMLEAALTRWMKDHFGVECASVTVTRKPKPDAVQPQTREQVLEGNAE